MIHTNRWTPDTCPGDHSMHCRLIWQWDDAENPIVGTLVASEFICPAHQLIGLLPGPAHWDWNMDENRRKNITLVIGQAEHGPLTPDDYSWSYSAARVLLTVSFAGLNPQQKVRIQAACDLQFGPARVLVQ